MVDYNPLPHLDGWSLYINPSLTEDEKRRRAADHDRMWLEHLNQMIAHAGLPNNITHEIRPATAAQPAAYILKLPHHTLATPHAAVTTDQGSAFYGDARNNNAIIVTKLHLNAQMGDKAIQLNSGNSDGFNYRTYLLATELGIKVYGADGNLYAPSMPLTPELQAVQNDVRAYHASLRTPAADHDDFSPHTVPTPEPAPANPAGNTPVTPPSGGNPTPASGAANSSSTPNAAPPVTPPPAPPTAEAAAHLAQLDTFVTDPAHKISDQVKTAYAGLKEVSNDPILLGAKLHTLMMTEANATRVGLNELGLSISEEKAARIHSTQEQMREAFEAVANPALINDHDHLRLDPARASMDAIMSELQHLVDVAEPLEKRFVFAKAPEAVPVDAPVAAPVDATATADTTRQTNEPEAEEATRFPTETDADPMYPEAVRVAAESGKISTSTLQRRLRVGYGRAARMLDTMQQAGIIGEPDGSRPRDVNIEVANAYLKSLPPVGEPEAVAAAAEPAAPPTAEPPLAADPLVEMAKRNAAATTETKPVVEPAAAEAAPIEAKTETKSATEPVITPAAEATVAAAPEVGANPAEMKLHGSDVVPVSEIKPAAPVVPVQAEAKQAADETTAAKITAPEVPAGVDPVQYAKAVEVAYRDDRLDLSVLMNELKISLTDTFAIRNALKKNGILVEGDFSEVFAHEVDRKRAEAFLATVRSEASPEVAADVAATASSFTETMERAKRDWGTRVVPTAIITDAEHQAVKGKYDAAVNGAGKDSVVVPAPATATESNGEGRKPTRVPGVLLATQNPAEPTPVLRR